LSEEKRVIPKIAVSASHVKTKAVHEVSNAIYAQTILTF